MKVCFLAHNADIKNGGGRLVFELATRLKKVLPGGEIEVLTSSPSGPDFARPVISPGWQGLISNLFRLRRHFKKSDLIHAFDLWPYGFLAVAASLGLKKKIVITLVGSGSVRPLYHLILLPILKRVCRRADKLAAISSYTAGEVFKKIPGLKIEVIPLGVDGDYFRRQAADAGQPDVQPPYILSVGRLKPRKGYHLSLKVFAQVAAAQPTKDLKYVIVGSGQGEYFDKLQRQIKDLGLTGRVIFKQNISDQELAAFYKNASLFLLLSQNDNHDIEGFGLVFLEAAAFGLPVIGAKDCGAQDAILDGQNGFLVPPQDINEAAQKTLLILRDKALREKMAANSIKLSEDMTNEKLAAKYFNLYERAKS